jgi:hypothetical protein
MQCSIKPATSPPIFNPPDTSNHFSPITVHLYDWFMSTRQLIDKEIASLPEELQRKLYDFAMRLKKNARR